MSAEDNQSDSCVRAASAAIEVVREECSEMDVDVREVEDGMLMEIPSSVADRMDEIDTDEISLREFADLIDDSPFVRNWVAGVVASRGIPIDADSDVSAGQVFSIAGTLFEEDFAFTETDLVGSDVLKQIADAQ